MILCGKFISSYYRPDEELRLPKQYNSTIPYWSVFYTLFHFAYSVVSHLNVSFSGLIISFGEDSAAGDYVKLRCFCSEGSPPHLGACDRLVISFWHSTW